MFKLSASRGSSLQLRLQIFQFDLSLGKLRPITFEIASGIRLLLFGRLQSLGRLPLLLLRFDQIGFGRRLLLLEIFTAFGHRLGAHSLLRERRTGLLVCGAIPCFQSKESLPCRSGSTFPSR